MSDQQLFAEALRVAGDAEALRQLISAKDYERIPFDGVTNRPAPGDAIKTEPKEEPPPTGIERPITDPTKR